MGTRRSAGGAGRTLVVALVLGTVLAAGLWLARQGWDTVFSCGRPPSQQERVDQEAFVLASLPDATGLEWTVMDCDDRGQAYLGFRTRRTPAEARQAFAAGAACSALATSDPAGPDLRCRSAGVDVELFFEAGDGRATRGELYPPLS